MVNHADEKKYQVFLEEELKMLQSFPTVVIFGASHTGCIALKALKYMGVNVKYFCDNDIQKQGKSIKSVTIISPQQLACSGEEYPVIVALLDNRKAELVRKQLSGLGITHVINKDSFLYLYYTEMIRNGKKKQEVAQLLYRLSHLEDRSGIIFDVVHLVTNKCTLKCKNCGTMVPYCREKKEFLPSIANRDIEKLTHILDGVYNVSILGGEPFLHKDILEICQYACGLKNVLNIVLTTNASIVPDIDFKELAATGVIILISDYGILSPAKNELISILEKHDIVYTVKPQSNQWMEIKAPDKQYRSCMVNHTGRTNNTIRIRRITWTQELIQRNSISR